MSDLEPYTLTTRDLAQHFRLQALSSVIRNPVLMAQHGDPAGITMAVVTADHLILNPERFRATVAAALDAAGKAATLPMPEIQIFGGGAHAGGRIDIQDLMVVCPGAASFAQAMSPCTAP